jgi:hypothetical protein
MKQTMAMFFAALFLAGTFSAGTMSAQSTTSRPEAEQLGLQLQEIFKREPTDKVDTTEVANLMGLPEALAKAIVWNNYWFVYWPGKVSKSDPDESDSQCLASPRRERAGSLCLLG